MNAFQFTAKANKGEILLYGPIGRDFWGEGISAKDFADQLSALGELSEINVRINSPGGSAFDGLAIYNTLNRHAADVVVDIDGLAASAASVVAMGGDTIRMAENALMMIHNAAGFSMGTASEMEKTAKILRTLDTQLATTYSQRSGTGIEEIARLMEAETFFTAQEAKDKGLATDITEAKKIAAHFDPSKFSWLNKMPEGLLSVATPDCSNEQSTNTETQRSVMQQRHTIKLMR